MSTIVNTAIIATSGARIIMVTSTSRLAGATVGFAVGSSVLSLSVGSDVGFSVGLDVATGRAVGLGVGLGVLNVNQTLDRYQNSKNNHMSRTRTCKTADSFHWI